MNKYILLYVLFTLFATAFSLQAQVTISGSTGADGNYVSINKAVEILNSANGGGPTAQAGKSIVMTVTANYTEVRSIYFYDRGWNSLLVEGGNYTADMSASSYNTRFSGAKNLTFKNLVFKGGDTSYALHISTSTKDIVFKNCKWEKTSGQSGQSIYITDSDNITFTSCEFKNVATAGYSIDFFTNSTNVIVDSCTFYVGGQSGVGVSGAGVKNIVIKNSLFTKNTASYRTDDLYSAIFVANNVNSFRVQNNQFRNILRSERVTNVINVTNTAAKTIIIEGNSFYETQDLQLPPATTSGYESTQWSRYIYVGGGYLGGAPAVEDLRVKNNFFGSTAAKCRGNILNLGTNAVVRNFICLETSTKDKVSHGPTMANVDSIVGNHFRKISMTTTSQQAPEYPNGGAVDREDMRGSLSAYYNYYGGLPRIIDNVVDSLFLTGLSTSKVYLVGLGHSGSEPRFERNIITNLVSNNPSNLGSGSISGICLGAINLYNNPDATSVILRDNIINNLTANSTAQNSAQHVIGIRFTNYGGVYEGPCFYIGNKISHLDNKASSSQAHLVAGLYSEHTTTSNLQYYRKVYRNNEISDLSLNKTSGAISVGIYFKEAKSSYIEGNIIRNIRLENSGNVIDGVYGIYTPNSDTRNDTIVGNRISHLIGPLTSLSSEEAGVIGIRSAGRLSRIYNNFISALSLNPGGGVEHVTAIFNNGGGVFYNNVISICNSDATWSIFDKVRSSTLTPSYYYNTVYVNSSSSNSYAFRALNTSNTSTAVANNVFHNAGNGYGFFSPLIATRIITASNNLYYAANGTAYYNNGNTSIVGGSYSVKPLYIRANFCVVNNTEKFKLQDSTAASLFGSPGVGGITTDIGGNLRSVSAPTIGAWEGLYPYLGLRFFVDYTATTGNNDGSSWENAFLELSDALSFASENGDSIFIAKGAYEPLFLPETASPTFDRDKTFMLKSKLKIFGGYPNGLSGTNIDFSLRNFSQYETILSGAIDPAQPDDYSRYSHHVLLAVKSTDVLLDGLTVKSSMSNGGTPIVVKGKSVSRLNGGGIAAYNSGIELKNIKLENNRAELGATVYNDSTTMYIGDSLIVRGGIVSNQGQGAAFYNSYSTLTISGSGISISDNDARSGIAGAIYNTNESELTISGDVKIENNAAGLVGAIYNGNASITNLNGNVNIKNNISELPGGMAAGAIYNEAQVNIAGGVRIEYNEAVQGGGISNVSPGVLNVKDSVYIINNKSSGLGGGIYNAPSAVVNITDSVQIVGNEVKTGGGIYSKEGDVIISGKVALYDNKATGDMTNGYGGAIALVGGNLSITGETRLFDNMAVIDGGAIAMGSGLTAVKTNALIVGADIYNNTVTYDSGRGGGIAFGLEGMTAGAELTAIVANSKIRGNRGNLGGGVYYTPKTNNTASPIVSCKLTFYNTLISGNTDYTGRFNYAYGAGVYRTPSGLVPDTLVLNNTTIAGNFEEGTNYSAIYAPMPLQQGLLSVNNSIVSGSSTLNTMIAERFTRNNSLIEGLVADSTNLDGNLDPLFLSPVTVAQGTPSITGNYRLQSSSPAAYMGDASFVNSNYNTDLDGNARVIDGYIDMGAYQQNAKYWIGTELSKDWNVVTNWIVGIPDANADIYFHPQAKNDLSVNPSTKRIQGSVFENTSGKQLHVAPGAYLKITGDLNGFDESNFIIQSDSSSINGTFIYPQGKTVRAKVEMYSKAITGEEFSKSSDFKWQFITSPVASFSAKNLQGSWVRKYEESYPNNKYWISLNNDSTLYLFKGYEISRKVSTNSSGITTFFGELVNDNQSVLVTNTETLNPYKGKMIMGNPYTAPLHIQTGLTFGADMESMVYLFNSGSSKQWSASNEYGSSEGQYFSIPQARAGDSGIPSVIASMQGFVVQVDSGTTVSSSSVTFNYSGVSDERVHMRVATNNSEKSSTIIRLSSNMLEKDIMWLFVEENMTRNFDNGYDGRKLFAQAKYAQLFASEEDGNYQVNSIPNIDNTYLSIKAEEGTSTYRITFNHVGKEYEQLFLCDLLTGGVVDISENGSTYDFVANNINQAEKRFKISTKDILEKGWYGGKPFLEYGAEGVIMNNVTNEIVAVKIFDSTGRDVNKILVGEGAKKNISSGLGMGVYVLDIRVGALNYFEKIIVK